MSIRPPRSTTSVPGPISAPHVGDGRRPRRSGRRGRRRPRRRGPAMVTTRPPVEDDVGGAHARTNGADAVRESRALAAWRARPRPLTRPRAGTVCVLPHRGYARDRIARAVERRARARARRARPGRAAGDRRAGRPHRARRGDAARRTGPRSPGEALGPLFATYWLRGDRGGAGGVGGRARRPAARHGGEATLWLDGEPVQGAELRAAHAARRRGARRARRRRRARSRSSSSSPATTSFGFGEAGQGAAATLRAARAASSPASTPRRGRTWHDLEVLRALEREPRRRARLGGLLLAELHAFTLDGDRGRLARLLAPPRRRAAPR